MAIWKTLMYKMEDWERPHWQIWLKSLKNVNSIFVDLKHSLFQFWKSLKIFKFLKIKLAMNILDLNYSKKEDNIWNYTHKFVYTYGNTVVSNLFFFLNWLVCTFQCIIISEKNVWITWLTHIYFRLIHRYVHICMYIIW